MADVTLGTKGLVNADLIFVQNASFSCIFFHQDDQGAPIDHEGWGAWCRLSGGSFELNLNDSISFGDEGAIHFLVTDEQTASIPLGTYDWDLIVEDLTGYATRIAYGRARVYDSWARD